MLAVFNQTVVEIPEGLVISHATENGGGGGSSLVDHFSKVNDQVVTVSLGVDGALAYSTQNKNIFLPRLFAAKDDIFCIFEGRFENFTILKQQYGLNKCVNEAIIVIEAYKTLRDRGPYSAAQVMRDLKGSFAFVLFDGSSKFALAAADADGKVPFFWGADSYGHLVLSDDVNTVKQGCGNSFAPFPTGCFFTTSGGLQSFEHPQNKMKAMPRVDSKGQVCGATYKVDSEIKGYAMPRVGSATNWSSQY